MVVCILFDDRTLDVMLHMSRLQHASERAITEQLRRNNIHFTSRDSLRRILERLCTYKILKHDLIQKEYVFMYDNAEQWLDGLSLYIKKRQVIENEMKQTIGKIKDHIFMGGSPIYSWVDVKIKRRK